MERSNKKDRYLAGSVIFYEIKNLWREIGIRNFGELPKIYQGSRTLFKKDYCNVQTLKVWQCRTTLIRNYFENFTNSARGDGKLGLSRPFGAFAYNKVNMASAKCLLSWLPFHRSRDTWQLSHRLKYICKFNIFLCIPRVTKHAKW